MELFAASIIFDVDIWVYIGHSIAKWQLFSRSGFDLSKTFESPSNEGIYLMLQGNHYSTYLKLSITNLLILVNTLTMAVNWTLVDLQIQLV